MFVAPGEYADIRELAEQTMSLQDRMEELAASGVESVRHAAVPPEAAPIDAFAMGSLQVTLAPAALPAVIALVQAWLTDRPVPSVRIAVDGDILKVHAVPTRRQRLLVDAFLHRHSS
ncbi:hypothetical protein ACTMTJ_15770 [Phytohabitans sp. LJ34]|uniref:hypothetical protein n=1 Tax=Phytohabitans sp. LJ34 TaxID=3452217 RepID=UPI003F8CBF56